MATKNKTKETNIPVVHFINSFVESAQKKQESFQLIELMREWSGCEPMMWGPSIIGFGKYHYKYDSGHEGEAPLIGFSPRKAAFSLYVNMPGKDNKQILAALGKYTMGKSCIYIKKLSDLHIDKLEQLCKETIFVIGKKYRISTTQS